MQKKTIEEIEEEYELELDRIVDKIKKEKARKVLLQFPDGLKPYATVIAEELERRMKNVQFFIWLDSCYGACDVPNIPDKVGVDLVVQFGHSEWKQVKIDL